MSLLQSLRTPLRAVRVSRGAARMSSLPGSSLPGATVYEDEPMMYASSSEYDADLPPTAPASAYPQANPPTPNPLKTQIILRPKSTYALYVRSNSNNNIVTFTRPDGSPLLTVSGGQCGFKHKNRASAEAAHQCAVRTFARVREVIENEGADHMAIELKFNGWGRGREAVFKALMATEGEGVRQVVKRVTDITPIKIGGTRAKKARRM